MKRQLLLIMLLCVLLTCTSCESVDSSTTELQEEYKSGYEAGYAQACEDIDKLIQSLNNDMGDIILNEVEYSNEAFAEDKMYMTVECGQLVDTIRKKLEEIQEQLRP